MPHWSEDELKELLQTHPEIKVIDEASGRKLLPSPIKRPDLSSLGTKTHKYHAIRTEYNGKSYPSKKEAQHAEENDLKIKGGYLSFYLEQVPIRLFPSKVIYRLDFLEFEQVKNTPLYEVSFVEVKGYKTKLGEVKRKIAEAVLGIEIKVV